MVYGYMKHKLDGTKPDKEFFYWIEDKVDI